VVARITPGAAEHWQDSFTEASEMLSEAGVEVILIPVE
jgi:hypothetical protein